MDWFASPTRRHSVADTHPSGPTGNTSIQKASDSPDRPAVQRAITAPLTTPHDAVLSLLTGPSRDAVADTATRQGGRRSEETPSAVPLTRNTSTSLERAGEDTSTLEPASAHQARSTATTPNQAISSGIENVYDPFTGNITGVVYPRSAEQSTTVDSDTTTSKKKDSLQFDQAKDDLWSHLARIRDLQSEIAGMHVNMEGIGSSEGGRAGQKRPAATTAARMHTDTIGVGDEWVDAEQEAQAREKARDAEFTKLAESFEGRRTAIDDIMSRLDDLSKALTTFHTLPTPHIDMVFRSNTKDSNTTSPILRSPSPMFTNPASSPPPGSPPPMSPTSPPPDYGRRGKLRGSMSMIRTDFGFRSDTRSPVTDSPISE